MSECANKCQEVYQLRGRGRGDASTAFAIKNNIYFLYSKKKLMQSKINGFGIRDYS